MRPKGSGAQLEARRRRAVALLDKGLGVRAVARTVDSSPASVSRWKEAVAEGGVQALAAKAQPGRPARLSTQQKERLLALLLQGPQAHGYASQLWTLARVAQMIESNFDISYHPAHIWKILRACGWSAQKPEMLARERDEAHIRQWRQRRWPHIKKGTPPRV